MSTNKRKGARKRPASEEPAALAPADFRGMEDWLLGEETARARRGDVLRFRWLANGDGPPRLRKLDSPRLRKLAAKALASIEAGGPLLTGKEVLELEDLSDPSEGSLRRELAWTAQHGPLHLRAPASEKLANMEAQRERLAARESVEYGIPRAAAEPVKVGGCEENSPGATIRRDADFAWLTCADGEHYDFSTGRQREIMRVLFERWEASGCRDGARVTETAILEELGASTERLRVAARFVGHPALNTILRRCDGAEAAWALHLHKPTPPGA